VHQVGKKSERATKTPDGLFFQHAGHRFSRLNPNSLVCLSLLLSSIESIISSWISS